MREAVGGDDMGVEVFLKVGNERVQVERRASAEALRWSEGHAEGSQRRRM